MEKINNLYIYHGCTRYYLFDMKSDITNILNLIPNYNVFKYPFDWNRYPNAEIIDEINAYELSHHCKQIKDEITKRALKKNIKIEDIIREIEKYI